MDCNNGSVYYDLEFDRDAIEASFAGQYGIRLSKEEIGVGEFLRLLSGLMPDTPLGQLVSIRSGAHCGQGPAHLHIRRDWALFRAKHADVADLQNRLAAGFS